jgi:hypothetical protein
MEGPIVRIDVTAPVTVFDARGGVRGGAGDVVRFDGSSTPRRRTACSRSTRERERVSRWKKAHGACSQSLVRVVTAARRNDQGIYRIKPGGPLNIIKMERELYDMFAPHRPVAHLDRVR